MAQQFNDKEKKQFKKEIKVVLKAIEELSTKDAVRLNNERLSLNIDAKNCIKRIETHFDESQIN